MLENVVGLLKPGHTRDISRRSHQVTVAHEQHATPDPGFDRGRNTKINIDLLLPKIGLGLGEKQFDQNIRVFDTKSRNQRRKHPQTEHRTGVNAQNPFR